MTCITVHWSVHVLQRMKLRGTSPDEILQTIESGDPIEDYPNHLPLGPVQNQVDFVPRPIACFVGR